MDKFDINKNNIKVPDRYELEENKSEYWYWVDKEPLDYNLLKNKPDIITPDNAISMSYFLMWT
jgi:hypothetical protein